MPRVIKLRQIGTDDDTLSIAQSALFGREPDPAGIAEGVLPPELSDLERAVIINGLSPERQTQVSRNHCVVYRDAAGAFYLVDVGSTNGTRIGTARLKPSEPHALRYQDQFHLGEAIGFQVADILDVQAPNYALLVGGKYLPGVENGIALMSQELSSRGFEGNISTLLDDDATPQNIVAHLHGLRTKLTADSHFIFYYHGHGFRFQKTPNEPAEGALCLANGYVTPKGLYTSLRELPGKKAVILDCCFAGLFREYNDIPPHTYVAAGSQEDAPGYSARTIFVDGDYIGTFTKHLLRYFQAHPGEFNLVDVEEELATVIPASRRNRHFQEPTFGGTTTSFTIVAK